ncbi:MAG: hypothetical protein IT380_19105 [Myxococcales bacterium]|nr:hypothetical protein [Myxococcales bacterium]
MRRSDDFPAEVARVLRERAGTRCSLCDRQTTGPHSSATKSLRSGVAAHICAAQKGGPRFNPRQSSAARRSAANGIWVCHACSDIIDKDVAAYPARDLRKAKSKHERKIKAEHRGAPRSTSTEETVARLLAEQRQAGRRQQAAERAAQQALDAHQQWATAAIVALRQGPGNALNVAVEDEHHARWAIAKGLLTGSEWSSGLSVSLRQGFFAGGDDDHDDGP